MRGGAHAAWLLALGVSPLACEAQSQTQTQTQAQVSGWIGAYAITGNDLFANRNHALGARAHLEATASSSDLSSRLAIEGISDGNFGDKTRSSFVREAWVRHSQPSFDLTIGRQYLPEGRSDWIRPQNQFAPRDLSQVAVLGSDQRLGLPAIRYDWFPSAEWTIATAFIRQDRNDLVPIHGSEVPDLKPLERHPKNANLLRADWRHGIWEVGTALSLGWASRPLLRFQGPLLTADSYRQKRMAVDGSVNLNGDIFRWDMAVFFNDLNTLSGLATREQVISVGWDTRIFRDTTLSTQLIDRRAHFSTDVAEGVIGEIQQTNRRLSLQFKRHQSWSSFNLRHQVGHQHELEAGCLLGLKGDEHMGFFRWSWNFSDQWRLSGRAQFARGDNETFAGNINPSKTMITELRYQF